LLSKRIPAAGLKLFGRTLRRLPVFVPEIRPRDNTPITAWFERSSPEGKLSRGFPAAEELESWRIFARSSTGQEFQNAPGTLFIVSTNTHLWSTPLAAFPRAEQKFSLRIHPWLGKGRAAAPVDFRVANPTPLTPRRWHGGPLPQTNQLGEVQVILARAVQPPRFHPGRPTLVNDLNLMFQFRQRSTGDMETEWAIVDCVVEDEEGNQRRMNDWSSGPNPTVLMLYTLATNRPWRVTATVARANRFPAAELTPLNFDATNSILVTNAGGQTFRCDFDGWNASVFSTAWASLTNHPHLGLLATDATGKELPRERFEKHESQAGLGPLKWGFSPLAQIAKLQLVTPKVLQTEFLVMPGTTK
jgi:hypothetical protein